MSENAVAVVSNYRELSVNEVKTQVVKVQELMQDLMQEGTHFGKTFPGDTKKNLLKPGADKLCFMFRLRPDFTQEIKELPGEHMEVLTQCKIYHIESGQKIAEGVGMATTMESKYRWRNSARKCPVCGKETIKKSKFESGGFYCYEKIGGCGAKFREDDPAITEQVTGMIENPDIADTYNTVIKMSKKRAYVDATITACAASDLFTQDLEDLTKEDNHDEPYNEKEAQDWAQVQPKETPMKEAPRTERQKVIDEIVAVFKTNTPDGTDFFTSDEKNGVKEKITKTKEIDGLLEILSISKKELEKRRTEYKPIPFGDEPTTEQKDFADDIPWKTDAEKPESLKGELNKLVREGKIGKASDVYEETTAQQEIIF